MQHQPPMTVGQLKDRLRELPDDLPVIASYDCDCAYGNVVDSKVDIAFTYEAYHEPAVILVVG